MHLNKTIKYPVIACLLLLITTLQTKAQNIPYGITLTGCESKWQISPDNLPFGAVKDNTGIGTTGQILFNPGNGNHWNFSWTYNGINQPVDYENDSTLLTVDIKGDGIYAFHAQKEGTNNVESGQFRLFGVHIPEFGLEILNEDDCFEILLRITGFVPPVYNNGGTPYYGSNNVQYLFSDRTAPFVFTNYQRPEWTPTAATAPENIMFSVKITDMFGFSWTSTEVEYLSVVPDASFTVDPKTGEAPLEVNFANTGKNTQEVNWYLFRDTADMAPPLLTLEDSLIDNTILADENFTYTYEHPGYYKVYMIAYNTKGVNHCSDTTEAIFINVDPSLVDVPNVFTPNGDGKNDEFRVKAQSLENFKGVIINRWGRQVFEWNDPEKGWDGRINGKLANPGTYYYIITARGREMQTKKYTKKGALLLIR